LQRDNDREKSLSVGNFL